MTTRFYEDFEIGEAHEYGGRTLSADDIIRFAREFDPQFFHLDPEAAKDSAFGGLVASGWHTCALAMRMMVEAFLDGAATIASPGVGEIRWLKPVRPGDTLRVRTEVIDKTPSKSKPDRGLIRFSQTVRNQNDDVVMTMINLAFFLRRPEQGDQGRG